jgi:hypothetical protein
MGHRANYAIRRNGDYDLYYSNWGALTVPQDLFWGPDYAEAFIRENAAVGHDEWLDDVFGEGGAVLDLDRETIVLFGGEVLAHPPYRTVLLELMQGLWGRWGWTVEWAEWGTPDLARQVGEEPLELTSGPTGEGPPAPDVLGSTYEQSGRIVSLVTILDDGEPTDRATGYDVDEILGIGPDVLGALDQLPTLERVRREHEPPEYMSEEANGLRRSIRNCLVVDRDRRRLVFWGHVRLGELAQIEEAWEGSGWTVERRTGELDHIEAYFEATGRDVPTDLELEWERPSRDEVIEEIAERLFEERDIDPADHVRRAAERLDDEGDDVDIDPRALDSPIDGRPDEETCRKRFGWALAAVTEG